MKIMLTSIRSVLLASAHARARIHRMIADGSILGLLAALACAGCSRPEEPKPAPRAETAATSQAAPQLATTATLAPNLATAPNTLARVRAAAGKILGTELTDKSDDVPFTALPKPADDLDVVETILALEEEFEIEIPDAALAAFDRPEQGDVAGRVTVRALAAIVDDQLRRKAKQGAPAPSGSGKP